MKRRDFIQYIFLSIPLIALPIKVIAQMTPSNQTFKKLLINTLKSIGNEACLKAVKQIKNNFSSTISLELRNSKLTRDDIFKFANTFTSINPKENQTIRTLSLSYNPIGDEGAIALAQSMPTNIKELGLVGCNIGDDGGQALLEWFEKANYLTLFCIEGNLFSVGMKTKFRKIAEQKNALYFLI